MNNEINYENINQFQNNNMNSQNNKNDKWKDTLILILVIIVFILTAVSLYLIIDMKNNDIDTNKDNDIQENDIDKIDDTKGLYYVIDGKEYEIHHKHMDEYTETISFDYPVININTNSIKDLNNQIKNMYDNLESEEQYNNVNVHDKNNLNCSCVVLDNGYNCGSSVKSYSYGFDESNKFLTLTINESSLSVCTSGLNEYNYYNISIKDGKVLSDSDLIKYFGFDEEEMFSNLEKYFEENTDYDKSYIDTLVKSAKLRVYNDSLVVKCEYEELVYDGNVFKNLNSVNN